MNRRARTLAAVARDLVSTDAWSLVHRESVERITAWHGRRSRQAQVLALGERRRVRRSRPSSGEDRVCGLGDLALQALFARGWPGRSG